MFRIADGNAERIPPRPTAGRPRAVAVLLLSAWATLPAGAVEAPREAPLVAPSSAALAPDGEPGEPLSVSGTVYAADGRTPVTGASLYVYQTDARGHYRPEAPMGNDDPRLRAYLRSDADGRYSFTTIRPGSYPRARVPAHIHYVVRAPGYVERVFEIVFEDDPLVSDRLRAAAARLGSFYSLRPVERDAEGRARVTQDVRLEPAR